MPAQHTTQRHQIEPPASTAPPIHTPGQLLYGYVLLPAYTNTTTCVSCAFCAVPLCTSTTRTHIPLRKVPLPPSPPPPFFRIHFLSDASFAPATRQPPFPLCIVTPSPPIRLLLRRRTRPTAPTTLLSPSPTRHKRRWSRSYTATTSLDGSVTTSTPTSSLVYDHRQAPSTPG